jgi:hypothetical protein
MRPLFYIAVADGAGPCRPTNVPEQLVETVSVGVAPLLVSSIPESPDHVEHPGCSDLGSSTNCRSVGLRSATGSLSLCGGPLLLLRALAETTGDPSLTEL